MKILPMYANAPETADLVYHTVKHFLDADEAPHWDLVPAGSLGAEEARARAAGDGLRPPPTGREVDPGWWWPPWRAFALDAHDRGYRPRYELLLRYAPDPAGPRWEPAARGRRTTTWLGFRLVLERAGDDWQVITAYFSPFLHGAGDLQHFGPALRAFAARRNCPAAPPVGVSGGETKP